jgi:DnaJ-class molecular chaperone
MAKCAACNGVGEIQATAMVPAGRGGTVIKPVVTKRRCPACHGLGQVGGAEPQAATASAEEGGVNPIVWRVVVVSAALAAALYFAL